MRRSAMMVLVLVATQWVHGPAAAASPRATKKAAPVTDVELIHQALYSCRHLSPSRRSKIDLNMLRQMLQLERDNGVPQAFSGMTLAKACIESGYTSTSRGDCKGKDCKAVGIIQLWPWTKRFGVDRSDPYASVRFLLQRVQVGLKHLHRKCPKVKGTLDRYQIAWLRINRGPKQHGLQRCEGLPHGLRLLKKWHENIQRVRRKHLLAERRATRAAARRIASAGGAKTHATAATLAKR